LDENAATVDAAGQGEQQQPGEIADQAQTPDGSPPSQLDSADGTQEAKKVTGGFQKRIGTLTGRVYDLSQAVSAKDQRIAELEAKLGGQAAKPDAAEQPPDEAKFNDYAEYLRAVARYEGRQEARAIAKADREQAEAQRREATTREQLQSQQRSFLTQVETLAAEVPDFQSSVQSLAGQIQSGGPLAQALLQSDKGAALAYFLAAHPAEMARIDAMSSPVRAAIEIARLESRADAHIQSRTRSKASRQASPLDAGGAPQDGAPESATSMEEFARRYYAQRRKG
jgi:chromosome segregation ATPase